MPYCSQCGVELGDDVITCPLCSTPVQKEPDQAAAEVKKKYPDIPVDQTVSVHLDPKKMRLFAFEVMSICILTPILIVILTNFLIDWSITWAWYPITVLGVLWLGTAAALFLYRMPLFLVLSEILILLGFLWGIDYLVDFKIDWFLPLALPIVVDVVFSTVLVVMASLLTKKKGANIAAYVLFGIGIVTGGLDFIISSNMYHTYGIGWSLYVIVPGSLVGFFLLYVHYRGKKFFDAIRKRFQI
jgi:hypothetical protein